jgi:hypothetical protein
LEKSLTFDCADVFVRLQASQKSALETQREIQQANEEAAERARKEELRAAQLRSERANIVRRWLKHIAAVFMILTQFCLTGPAYEFKKVEQVSAVSEIRLDTGVVKWGNRANSRSCLSI